MSQQTPGANWSSLRKSQCQNSWEAQPTSKIKRLDTEFCRQPQPHKVITHKVYVSTTHIALPPKSTAYNIMREENARASASATRKTSPWCSLVLRVIQWAATWATVTDERRGPDLRARLRLPLGAELCPSSGALVLAALQYLVVPLCRYSCLNAQWPQWV